MIGGSAVRLPPILSCLVTERPELSEDLGVDLVHVPIMHQADLVMPPDRRCGGGRAPDQTGSCALVVFLHPPCNDAAGPGAAPLFPFGSDAALGWVTVAGLALSTEG